MKEEHDSGLPARMRALVTGGGGFLGNVLVRELLGAGHRVRVLDLQRGPSLEGLDIEMLEGSVLDEGLVDSAVQGVDVVFHVAAIIDLQPKKHPLMRKVNVEGTRIVADACLRANVRLVHTSSHAALDRGDLRQPFTEENPLGLNEKCLYHRSKAIGETVIMEYCERGLQAVTVNPGTMIGPHDYGPSMMGEMLLRMYQGKLPVLLDAVSDYVDVRDVARGMIAAAQKGRVGERYFLTGRVLHVREMTRAFGEVSGKKMPSTSLPLWAGWAAVPFVLAASKITGEPAVLTPDMLRASVSNDVVSHDKAHREFGFGFRPLQDTLSDALRWYKSHGMLS